MAEWKKIIVSGSQAELAGITGSLLTDDKLLFAQNGGAISSTGIDVNASGHLDGIFSGSFSGSFEGDGSGLTGVSAQVEESLNFGKGLAAGTFDGASPATASLDLSTLDAGAVNVAEDFIAILDYTDTVTKLESIADLASEMADSSTIDATNGEFSVLAVPNSLTDGNGIADFEFDGSGAASVAVQADSTTGGDVVPVSVSANGVGLDLTSIDGAGLGTSGAGELEVNVDDSTIEIATDALQIKDGGVTNAKLANDSIQIGTTDIALGATGSSIAGLTLTGVEASGSFSGSFQGDGSGLTGLATDLDIAGDSGTDSVDLLTDTLTFSGTANEIVTAVTDNTVTVSLPDDVTIGQDLTVSNDLLVQGDLVVQGTASFRHETTLEVADQFILMGSGSTTAQDGGIVVQQATQDVGELFGFDNGSTRWAVTSSFDASNSAFTPDAFMAVVLEGADETAAPARYQAKGNIFVKDNGDIFIYS